MRVRLLTLPFSPPASRNTILSCRERGLQNGSIQDIAILFNIIIIFLMFFNTFVFQAGLVNLLFHKFKGTITLTAVYFALSISLHVWVMNLRWKNSNRFVWTDGLQTLFVFQRLAAVLYCYFYKRTAVRLGDPRFYQDSLWLRKEFMQVRRLPLAKALA
ncbi:transmembrane protein 138 isoform X3 [Vicugna pacos]|uniref:Transmembrane protein 138 n=1 Tax=Vicugna pacos TaxID=30538 RepID=A0ABM5DZ34_VICPA